MKQHFVPRLALSSAVILLALAMLLLPNQSQAATQRDGFMIVNQSDWDIHQLFVSPTHKNSWGEDQLGDNIIKHGGGLFTIRSIACGHYDLKVADEDGNTCIIEDINICKDHARWEVTNKELTRCAGWGG